MQTLGEKIAILVKARGWQQKEFASSIGYTAEHFSRLLKANPLSGKALHRIAKGLDLSPEELTNMPMIGRGQMPALVNESDLPYPMPRVPDGSLETSGQTDFWRQEIARLHAELERLGEALTREQSISASLAESLRNLTAKQPDPGE